MTSWPARASVLWPAIVLPLAVLAGWSFWWRYRFLGASPYPVGIDGYYYAIQVRSLLAEGALYYPAAPLCFWFMAPFAALSDPITGAKLGAALGGALAVVPMYGLGRRAGGSRAAGLVAAALVATSAQSFYLSTEFVKTGLGMTVALAFLWALAWTLDASESSESRRSGTSSKPAESRPRRMLVRGCVAAVWLMAAALTHKLAVMMAAAGAVPMLWLAWRDRRRNPDDHGGHPGHQARLLGPVVWAVAAVFAVIVALGVIAPERFASPGDLGLIPAMLGGAWDWTLPSLRVPDGPALMFGHEVAKAGALALAALALLLAGRRGRWLPTHALRAHDRGLILGLAGLAVIAALPFLDVSDPQGLGFRLRLCAFVPMALCGGTVAGALLAHLAPLGRAAVAVPFAVALVMARPSMPREGVVMVHPAMQAAVRGLDGVVPHGDIIIVPERHIAFMATWYSGSPVRLRPEPVPAERRWRLMPMALMSPELARAIDEARAQAHLTRPRGLHPDHRNGLVIMPEATWQWILDQLPPGPRAHYQRWPTI